MKPIIGLGGSTLDILTLVEDYPREEGVFYPQEISMQGGGPVSTALVAAARLGSPTLMLDAIGDDWVGAQILAEFAREGVDAGRVIIRAGERSSVSSILVRKADGGRAILYKKSSAADVKPEELPLDVLVQAGVLHLNGHHAEACLAAACFCRERGIAVSLDGGGHAGKQAVMAKLVPLSDVCIVARQFAHDFTGLEELHAAAESLLAHGPRLVGITDGINGSWFWQKDGGHFHQPAFCVPDVVDTTGCGDSFHGGFLAAYVRGLPVRECARVASAVAAFKTRSLGGRKALPDWFTVENFINKNF